MISEFDDDHSPSIYRTQQSLNRLHTAPMLKIKINKSKIKSNNHLQKARYLESR